MKRNFPCILFLLSLPLISHAQTTLETDSAESNQLGVSVDALAFFRDNEYDSKMTKGYSLPGVWLRPALNYNPNSSIHLEAGFHALFFDGANKYPNYAYHDIGTWKGNQYQSGAHLLPWFRAQARIKKTTFVLGDIYGDLYHNIITPLYNKEQLMSADPEMGAQIIVDSRAAHVDLFLNWQSYQFEEDTHQEAFTVGLTSQIKLTKELKANINTLVQHRGGEQDITDMGVQTLCNGAIGVEWLHETTGIIDRCTAQLNAMGCYQQAGKLWQFDSGFALHAEGGVDAWKHLLFRLGYFYAPKNFISLYGNPFFSTVSIRDGKQRFDGMRTGYLSVDYHYSFGKNYTFGANVETFKVNSKGLNEFNFSFGLYIRVKPWFSL